MPRTFNLSVVAPDRTIVDGPVQALTAPGVEGYFGVWAGHAPMIAALKVGLLEYTDHNDQHHHVAITGGFVETSGDHAIVLADSAERASEIDIASAEAELERARASLRGEDTKMTTDEAVEAMERALNRIKAARRN